MGQKKLSELITPGGDTSYAIDEPPKISYRKDIEESKSEK